MHGPLHLNVSKQVDSDDCINVDDQEHKHANVDEGREGVEEGSEDYL
jgi:hypothetical protein